MNRTQDEHDGESAQTEQKGKFYTYVFEGDDYQTQDEDFTCGDLMKKHDVDFDVGLIRIRDDGTEEQCDPDEEVDFEGPGRRFKQAPEFKRG
jgi:hypothetical protein